MTRRASVDFSEVPEHQREIDKRLRNWARWSADHASLGVSPMFRLYRPDNYERPTPAEPIDGIDASRVQKGVSALPQKHRQALAWSYISRANPRRAAASIGESLEGLALLVTNARQMLIVRKV